MQPVGMERPPEEPDGAPCGPPGAPEQGAGEPAALRATITRLEEELEETRAMLGDHARTELAGRQGQRLEALGQLAAGVAHEINTPMQFISDNVHFLRDGFHGVLLVLDRLRAVRDAARVGPVVAGLLAEVDQAEAAADLDYLTSRLDRAFARTLEGIDRVSGIVTAMKVFAHPRNELAEVDINQVLTTTLTVARNEYKYVADVVTDLGVLPIVLAHAGDLNQAFLNLLVNAAHAIVDADDRRGQRGTITVRTRHDGDHVVVEIADTGCGIPEHIRPRIFDPFFTTKEPGRGTGQGLAITQAVIARHSGQLGFDTQVGLGTTFRVRLPVAGPDTVSARLRRRELTP